MNVKFDQIAIGSCWDRNSLARYWGCKSFHSIARGVVTPRSDNKIILFVTEQKQEGFVQYQDQLYDKILVWEGEQGHGNDRRIADADNRGDEIHIFHRTRHHEKFTYLGIASIITFKLFSDQPSKFEFLLKI